MVLNKGGYVMINKAQDNVYELATSALTSGKPILWYELNTECYFIDTITLSGTNIILTKGGKTITIESDGDITESGNIQSEKINGYSIDFSVGTLDHISINIYTKNIITDAKSFYDSLIDKAFYNACYVNSMDGSVFNYLYYNNNQVSLKGCGPNNTIDLKYDFKNESEIFMFGPGETVPNNLTVNSIVQLF